MIACPNCRTIQSPDGINTGELFACPRCKTRMRADLFNAFYRPVAQAAAQGHVQEQGQAECYNHPGRPAKVPCAHCGRLLCELCAVDLDGRSLCFDCVKTGSKGRRAARLDTRRTHYDSLALALALVPVLFVFPTIVTAPAALYVALRYWKRKPLILPRSRWRYILAILLSVAQIVVWIVVAIRAFG
jgi:hypothetical protein